MASSDGSCSVDLGEEVTTPIESLRDLLDWKESSVNPCLIGQPMNDALGVLDGKKRPKTLVCHDMAGGYLEDRFAHGCVADSVYYIREWPYIDIFVYFSHHFVTIPPVGWINAAHVHNVPVLGTFITEWKDGEQMCAEFLSDSTKLVMVVDQLARIAAMYKFDGWLLNIENAVSHVDNLVSFVGLLTTKCKEIIGPKAVVIWYDSVTVEGELKWQDALNEKNRSFFDVCDGIFLNYGWDETKLDASVATAGDRLLDVYVGLDVFGRGCMGGGGYKSYQALRCIRQRELSVAFFAPGWVFECLGKKEFEMNQRLFWAMVAPGLHCKKIVNLPFSTNFVPGKRWYPSNVDPEGAIIDRCFFCLRDQEPQPHWFCPRDDDWPNINVHDQSTFPACTLSYFAHDYAHGYPAGSVLKPVTKDNDSKLRLFCCDLTLYRPIRVSLTYQAKGADVQLGLALSTRPHSGKWSVYLMPQILNADRTRSLFRPGAQLIYCQTSTGSAGSDVKTMLAEILVPKGETIYAIDLLTLVSTAGPLDCAILSFSISFV